MRYVNNTSKIILCSLISMHCYGMDPSKDSTATADNLMELLNHIPENSALASLLSILNNDAASDTPYFTAIRSGDLEAAKKFYKNTPYFFKQQDWSGYNALHIAADMGYLNIVEFLMEKDKKSLLQIPVRLGFYPIHMAAKKNYFSIVKIMCEKNKKIVTQKDAAYGGNILFVAATNGAKETVDYLMTNYPELLNETNKLGRFPHEFALAMGHKDLAASMEARLKLFEKTKNVNVTANSQKPEQLTKQTTKQSNKKVQKKQTKNQKNTPKQKKLVTKTEEGNQELVETKTALPVQESIPSQPQEISVLVITQETPVYTRTALKKLNVEDVKAIYEKTLMKGEIYEANPSKDKMITHILKHQNESKPDAKRDVPQIVLSDAERFANDNTSLTLFDPPKEKPKRKIRIENTLKKLSKKAEDWKARQIETAEDKASRKILRNQKKVIDSHPEERTFETSSISQSFGDFKSHFSITDSESLSTKSLVSQSEGGLDGIGLVMKDCYPQLFRLLKKENAQHLSEVKFKSSNIMRATLTLMKALDLIDGTIGKANIHVTRKNSTDAFVSHTTHGSSKHDKWYHNPEIVVNFFEFIAKCDPIIAEYLESIFEVKNVSRDISMVNDGKKPTDNTPNEAGED